jgi:site-specific recombinase XerD
VRGRSRELLKVEGKGFAYFIGKGGKEAEQELYEATVDACCEYFKEAFKRDPNPEHALFWSFPSYPGATPRTILYAKLWRWIKKIGSIVKEEGVIKRNTIFSPHRFWRSYATGLYKSGKGIRAIQQKTRHASIETLVKHNVYDDELATPYLEKMLE